MHQLRRMQDFLATHKSSSEGLWQKESFTETKYRGVLALRGRALIQDSREPAGQTTMYETLRFS